MPAQLSTSYVIDAIVNDDVEASIGGIVGGDVGNCELLGHDDG